jgi:hypothetical protein
MAFQIEALDKAFADILARDMRDRWDRVALDARENPEKHRTTPQWPQGVSKNWSYWQMKGQPANRRVRFCCSHHKNVAGFYLTWIELWTGKSGQRTMWRGWEKKGEAREYCEMRVRDANKPKAERKFTLPAWTDVLKRQ